MAEEPGVEYVLLDHVPTEFKPHEATALRHAIGQHDILIRDDSLANFVSWRDFYTILCGDRYCFLTNEEQEGRGECICAETSGMGCDDRVGNSKFVVLMSKEEVRQWCDRHVADGDACHSGAKPLLGCQITSFLCETPKWAEGLSTIACVFGSEHLPTAIEENFLYNFANISAFDFSGVRNVTAIGDAFLGFSHNLKTVDLTPFRGVREVGKWFLASCSSLHSLSLEPLHSVTRVGRGFLLNCIGIRELSLRGLENVHELDFDFMMNCRSVEVVDLSPLCNVDAIRSGFLVECEHLLEVRFSSLRSVRTVHTWGFLSGCGSLSAESLASAKDLLDAHGDGSGSRRRRRRNRN